MGRQRPAHIGPLWTRPLNSAAAQAACVPMIPPAGIVGVLLSRYRTDAASEIMRGEAAANGLRVYPPCVPANLKAGRVWQI